MLLIQCWNSHMFVSNSKKKLRKDNKVTDMNIPPLVNVFLYLHEKQIPDCSKIKEKNLH